MKEDLLEQVAEATALREGAEGVAQVLRIVYAERKITLKDLSRRSGLPVPVLAAVRGELEKAQILDRRAGLVLTERGHRFVQEHLQVITRHDPICPRCHGRRIVVAPELHTVVQQLASYFQRGPLVDVTLDQAPCLPETSLRRALYLYQCGALEGRAVVILGDDDLVSLAIGLLGQALGRRVLTRRLTVVESDQRWIDLIQDVSNVENFEIECINHDLRDPLPEDLRGRFDTFQTDPPYTATGMTLFVSQAIRALETGEGKHGFLSFGPKSPDEMLGIHQGLAKMGLVVHEAIPAFNQYAGASILGGSSQILHLLTTGSTRALGPDVYHGDPIYTGQLSPTTRLYICMHCKTEYRVGRDQPFTTIELLKASGCTECRNTSFRYVRRLEG